MSAQDRRQRVVDLVKSFDATAILYFEAAANLQALDLRDPDFEQKYVDAFRAVSSFEMAVADRLARETSHAT